MKLQRLPKAVQPKDAVSPPALQPAHAHRASLRHWRRRRRRRRRLHDTLRSDPPSGRRFSCLCSQMRAVGSPIAQHRSAGRCTGDAALIGKSLPGMRGGDKRRKQLRWALMGKTKKDVKPAQVTDGGAPRHSQLPKFCNINLQLFIF